MKFMFQGILAIILVIAAFAIYYWGRRSADYPQKENPDVILGLVETPHKSNDSQPEHVMPAIIPEPKVSLQRVILFLRAPNGQQYAGYELLQSLMAVGLRFGEMN